MVAIAGEPFPAQGRENPGNTADWVCYSQLPVPLDKEQNCRPQFPRSSAFLPLSLPFQVIPQNIRLRLAKFMLTINDDVT